MTKNIPPLLVGNTFECVKCRRI